MSFKSKELVESRLQVAEQIKQLVANVGKESVWTAEQREQFDKLDDEQKRLQDEIETATRIERANEILETRTEDKPRVKTLAKKALNRNEAFVAWLKGKVGKLGYDEERRFDGIDLRADEFSFDLQTRATDPQSSIASGRGLEFVPADMASEINIKLDAMSPIRQVAKKFLTPHGRQIDYPGSDDTASKAVIVAQNAATAILTIPTATLASTTYCYRSAVLVPVEWLEDAAYDVTGFCSDQLARRFWRGTGEHLALGTGSGQPEGYGEAASAGVTLTANDAVTYAEMVDWIWSVPLHYRQSPNFAIMASDSLAKVLRATVDDNGVPLWEPSVQDGMPDKYLGKPLFVDPFLEAMGSGGQLVGVCGDFAQFLIRSVQQEAFRITVARERHIEYLQIGIYAFNRIGTLALQPTALRKMITPGS